ncbi:alpha-amylase family glycosyl hydrolase [Streptomyces cylindrosporus]|uniref:Alpha-amylase family glycosyl hydrolase n=1 Tax=Streptomyces cylindrosporus TaxID=2927583 RepID=A0ABS9XZZ4_9ACTN|nr:alpha-amylase family glycosyl hydrolase [Streptomyces cylindrosporus]MCI3270537.1 alpha-amylase family glycosyl hydrolase [Streptomyces cylindrosporus]
MTVIYEINTLVWLGELSGRYGRPVTLGDVPGEVWDEVARPGLDTVWLMGVWERSPAGLRIALRDESLLASFRAALPDLTEADITGSAYCVRDYTVAKNLGGPAGLAEARAQLAARGMKLILDYVPNHIAPDHPWLTDRPDCLIRGTAENLARTPGAFVETGGRIYANGRDPYFAPWQDVVQLNAFSEELRTATVDTLVSIGDQADGVRCDMAMLLMNDVFAKTWGDRAGSPPAEDFWPYVIPRVRERHPDLLFVAEAYWDLEWALQHQGFDHCYDKRLYDRLLHEGAEPVRAHLQADLAYQRGLVRFLENHDEPRAAATLPGERQYAAAVAVATLPGATLWHEGQFEGRKVRPPVFLARRPQEPVDEQLREFYSRLLPAAARVRDGDWQLLATTGWPDNDTHRNLLAWTWTGTRHLVIVNDSDAPAQGQLPLPWPDLAGRPCRLTDLLTDRTYDRDGDTLLTPGLFVDLPARHSHVLALT